MYMHSRERLGLVHGTTHLPVGLQTVVYVNADVISDALLLFLPFISNFLCVQKKIKLNLI